MNLTVSRRRIPPVRGIISTHDVRGRRYSLTQLKKWQRVNAEVYKTRKVDVQCAAGGLGALPELLAYAPMMEQRLSLRIPAEVPPECVPDWPLSTLLDVLVLAHTPLSPHIPRWAAACAEAQLPLRVLVFPPNEPGFDAEAVAEILSAAAVVDLALDDRLWPNPAPVNRAHSFDTARRMNALVRALAERDTEVNLVGLPFCHADEENLPHCENPQQYFLDHQHYHPGAWNCGVQAFLLPPHRAEKFLDTESGRQTSFHNIVDRVAMPWILEHPAIYTRAWVLHKLTRHFRMTRQRPPALPENVNAAEAAVEAMRERQRRIMGPVCAKCRFQRVCAHETEVFQRRLPGLGITPVPFEDEEALYIDPLAFCREQPKYYDPIDAARHALPERLARLAEKARGMAANHAPTREITADDYEIQDHMTHHMPGAVRWYSFTNAELQSTPLTRVHPPFTIGVNFGGGTAECVGFSFGRHARIVCPMLAYQHRLLLHVDRDGEYVLLRDGEVVSPTEFRESYHVPEKLGGLLEPRISVVNVDGGIVTQGVVVWEGAYEKPRPENVRFSVLVVCTRYARRLEAALLGIAHQEAVPLEQIEVVVGYVPGIDATEDTLDSIELTFPRLRIVRSPFSKHDTRSKGFIINESLGMVSGDWVVLLDADIVLPPEFFARLGELDASVKVAAPDGRKMLPPEMTARVLLGAEKPWENYPAMLESDGEYRQTESGGVPIGYCQCVRREVFDEVSYMELRHFEGADWQFGKEVVDKFGKEHRLEGLPVLHLHHGGSQWYGTDKQM